MARLSFKKDGKNQKGPSQYVLRLLGFLDAQTIDEL